MIVGVLYNWLITSRITCKQAAPTCAIYTITLWAWWFRRMTIHTHTHKHTRICWRRFLLILHAQVCRATTALSTETRREREPEKWSEKTNNRERKDKPAAAAHCCLENWSSGHWRMRWRMTLRRVAGALSQCLSNSAHRHSNERPRRPVSILSTKHAECSLRCLPVRPLVLTTTATTATTIAKVHFGHTVSSSTGVGRQGKQRNIHSFIQQQQLAHSAHTFVMALALAAVTRSVHISPC